MLIRSVLLAGALVVAGVFAACGGDDDDDEGEDGIGGDSLPPVVKVVQDAKHGAILASFNGATLYTFTQDSVGKSVCTGSCAETWPPFEAEEPPKVSGATGEFTIVTRDDNKKQLALNGRPLYRYAPDKAGEVTGDGVGGVWFVAKANGEAPAASSSGTTPAPGTGADPYGY